MRIMEFFGFAAQHNQTEAFYAAATRNRVLDALISQLADSDLTPDQRSEINRQLVDMQKSSESNVGKATWWPMVFVFLLTIVAYFLGSKFPFM